MTTEPPQEVYETVVGESSFHQGATFPVESVSWHDSACFANALAELDPDIEQFCYVCGEGDDWGFVSVPFIEDCMGYRLPTSGVGSGCPFSCDGSLYTDYGTVILGYVQTMKPLVNTELEDGSSYEDYAWY